MNGAESVLRTAVAAGIEVCFANPGTTEMPLVLALDNAPGIRAVLGLFEGVCTGAADGYGRMAEKPALTLLHLGPGFANGIAYLHDARRARSPIVNLIGDMATWHLAADAPLTSDIHSLAKPVSAWVRSTRSSEEAAGDIATAIAVASALPGRIATLILPHDAQLESASGPSIPQEIPLPPAVGDDAIRAAASMLRKDPPAVLFLGGHALRARGLRAVRRIAAATGCKLICETFPARIERGAGMLAIERLPYFPEQGIALLSKFQSIVLAGALPPVSFFGYPGIPSYLISPEQASMVLATPEEDVPAALEALADSFDSKGQRAEANSVSRPAIPTGAITLETLAAAVTSVQPEGAIVMDEGNTSSAFYFQMSHSAPPFTYLAQPGGAIGLGMPCATGAAVACPDRPVICLQADGSGMYTLQSLWTQAREGLNVTTLLCNNRSYRVLGVELARAGVKEPGPQAKSMIGLTNPSLEWTKLAAGMGVPAVRVETADVLAAELKQAISEPGPHLIEVML